MSGFGTKRSFMGKWGGGQKKMKLQGSDNFYSGGGTSGYGQFGNMDYSMNYWGGAAGNFPQQGGNFQQQGGNFQQQGGNFPRQLGGNFSQQLGGNFSQQLGGNGIDFTEDYSNFYGKSQMHGRGRGGRNKQKFDQNGSMQSQIARVRERLNMPIGPQRGKKLQKGNLELQGQFQAQKQKKKAVAPTQAKASIQSPVAKPKAKPFYPDLDSMSMEEKLSKFCVHLRDDISQQLNSVITIMNAVTSSRLGIKTEYEVEELGRVGGKTMMYTGVLRLSGVFLAREIGQNKKEVKKLVFHKGLNILLSTPVEDLNKLVDPGAGAIRAELAFPTEAKVEIKKPKKSEIIVAPEGADVPTVLKLLCTVIKDKNLKHIPENPICRVEQAMTRVKCLDMHTYRTNVIKVSNSCTYHMGMVTFGDVVIGRGSGMSKKVCKNSSYEAALARLQSKSIKELMVSVPEEPIPELKEKKPTSIAKPEICSLPMEERLTMLIKSLSEMPVKNSSVNIIDIAALKSGLKPMVVYKTEIDGDDHDTQRCHFYLDKLHIAEGAGNKRKECTSTVYERVWELLRSTTAEKLLSENEQITDEDELRNISVVEVVVKGNGKCMETNIIALRRFVTDLRGLESNTTESMVIIENSDCSLDRSKNAFSTLLFSCTRNGLVMQWETESVKSSYRCNMSIQGKQLGQSFGNTKHHARNLAAADALFKLYETQDVIKAIPQNHQDKWIPYDAIKTEAEAMKIISGVQEQEKKKDENGKPIPDEYIMKVLKKKLETHVAENLSEEFVIGPGMGFSEIVQLKKEAKLLNLVSETRQNNNTNYVVIYERPPWQELAKKLRETGKQYGKYMYVEPAERPKHMDISGSILKEEPKEEEKMVIDVQVEEAT